MEILINGVGDAFAVKFFSTNFLIRSQGFLLAIDCPDSYRRALRDNGFLHHGKPLDAEHIDALFLTHLHGDHVNGLEMVAAYRRFVHQKKLPLYTPPEVADGVWEKRIAVSLGTMWDGQRFHTLDAAVYFDLHRVPWGEATGIGPFVIETRRTLHHIPTSALKISDGVKTLGYSCDTAFDRSLIEWLSPCDLILHETNHGPAHTPLERLLELPEEIQAKMLLIHYPEALAEIELPIRLARQGSLLSL